MNTEHQAKRLKTMDELPQDKLLQVSSEDKVVEATTKLSTTTDGMVSVAMVPGKCQFYVKKKRRYCKTDAAKGLDYCVVHSHEMGQSQSDRKRIACPLDSKHSCYEDQLDKHLRKCNARPGLNPPCYVQNINCGGNEGEDPNIYKVGIRDISDEEVLQLVKTVNTLHEEHVGLLETRVLFHEVLQDEADNPKNGDAALKHIKQQASLVGHMKESGLLEDGRSYLEFGAGKGGLSHWVQLALSDSTNNQYILIDKGSVRYKMDTYHKGADQGPNFQRLKINIQDLHLGKVSSLHNDTRPIVALGKHLCGGATDLMLRCLMKTTNQTEDQLKCNVSGLVLALCCHHRCDWLTYCGKEWFRRRGLGARDFHILSSMSSWATCGTRPVTETSPTAEATEENASETYSHHRYGNLLPQEREEIGRRCKQLIDRGRVHYLNDHGYDTQQICYIEREQTLENMALLATCRQAQAM